VLGYARSPGTRTNDPYDRIRMERVNQLQKQVAQAASELDRKFVQDRLAKLVGGVCQIIVRGVSNADIRERRDRVEDAVCSVRAAIRSGVLPGAGWGLLCCIRELHEQWSKDTDSLDNKIAKDILVPALAEPVRRLLRNASCPEVTYTMMLDEVEARRPVVHNAILDEAVYDVVDGRWVQPQEAGLFDALPAVTEALINSFSIALTLGQLGGLITSDFDREVELNEVRDNQEFERYANTNEANERI
jgi:chaperonin GroEL